MNSDELKKIIKKLKLIKEFTNSTEYKIIPKYINYNKDSNLKERFSEYFNRFEKTIVDYYEKTKLINSIKDNYLFILDRDLNNIMIYINELDKAIKNGNIGFDFTYKTICR